MAPFLIAEAFLSNFVVPAKPWQTKRLISESDGIFACIHSMHLTLPRSLCHFGKLIEESA
jgi:hypothetical protein